MKNIPLALTCLLVLAGCATAPTPLNEALITPDNRIFYHAKDDAQSATAIFVRDVGFVGSGVYQHLLINEEKAASIDVGEKVVFKLPEGDYVFGVIPTDPFGAAAVFSIDQRLEAKKIYHYRILTDGNTFSTRIQKSFVKSAQ